MKTHQGWKESLQEKLYFIHLHPHYHDEPASHPAIAHRSTGDLGTTAVAAAPAQEPGAYLTPHRAVNFFCSAPQAKHVELVGDFNHWHPYPMTRSLDGCWLASVELTHEHHQYRFVIDGEPALDPRANGIVRDEQNGSCSLVAVS